MEEPAADVFDGGDPKAPQIDIKALHAKIGALKTGERFFRKCAQQGRSAERKTMINRPPPPLQITRQASALGPVKKALINPGGIYSEIP